MRQPYQSNKICGNAPAQLYHNTPFPEKDQNADADHKHYIGERKICVDGVDKLHRRTQNRKHYNKVVFVILEAIDQYCKDE